MGIIMKIFGVLNGEPVGNSDGHSIGYGLSEDAQFALKDLAATFGLIAVAFDRMPADGHIDIEATDVAAMLRLFQRSTTAILADAPLADIRGHPVEAEHQ